MANFSVAAVFSDHCVLQRNKPVCFFGYGEDQDLIRVEILGKTYVTVVTGERWEVSVAPMKAMDNLTVTITNLRTNECKILSDVAVGEVWLAGGQSNMELEIQTMKDGPALLEAGLNDQVRFYYTPKIAFIDDDFYVSERNSGWATSTNEWAKAWSAVGYLYACELQKKFGCIVGIIGCNWGGTSASCWMSEEALSEDVDTKVYLDEFYAGIAGKTAEEQIREYLDYEIANDAWDQKMSAMYNADPNTTWDHVLETLGPCLWPGPMNIRNPFRPAGLYECMLKRVMPYTISGFLFYQGESDDHKPATYYKLFARMIRQWREDWGDDSLPFLFVQLPMHKYSADPDWKNWCVIREAQDKIAKTIAHTGMAVIIDSGEYNEIHPKNKIPVAKRLAYQAFSKVYQNMDAEEANGPIATDCYAEGYNLYIRFKYASKGFIQIDDEVALHALGLAKTPANLGIEIAGPDGSFVPAQNISLQNDMMIVSAPESVQNPVYARYLWTNYGPVSLFGTNQIPVAPFIIGAKRLTDSQIKYAEKGSILIHQKMEL